MSDIKITAYRGNTEAWRLHRLEELRELVKDEPGIVALHDHKGELTVTWRSWAESNMARVARLWTSDYSEGHVEHEFPCEPELHRELDLEEVTMRGELP